jgi:hypothetical protein
MEASLSNAFSTPDSSLSPAMTKLLDPELLKVTLSPQFLNPIARTHN